MEDQLNQRFAKRLGTIDEFPGWDRAGSYLESLIRSRGFIKVIDIGGGANPAISREFVRSQRIDYALLDISQAELDKASAHYTEKVCVDMTAPSNVFAEKVGDMRFDMAFSHMFVEHIQDPIQAHKNICSILRKGGLAVHLYPSPNNLPLAVNRVMPEWLSTAMVRLAQPQRDLRGHLGKFRAYYRMCGNPTRKLHRQFEQLGYRVVVHCGFVGHDYYRRFPVLRGLEQYSRHVLVSAGVGLSSAQLLILEKN